MQVFDSRASRPDAQAFDEVRITTHPRWKESEISGDEWRISARIQFFLKGHLIGERSWRNTETALRYGDWAVVDMFENCKPSPSFPDVNDLCDQEGCSERATHKFRVKKRYRNDGSVKEPVMEGWLEHRCFCERHKFRGDCGLDDADNNYELIEKIPQFDLSDIDKQNAEFDALTELKEKYDQLTSVAVVDDDYPSVRREYENALKNFLKACAINRPHHLQRALDGD